mmetsp:Transcript_662/g.772  ORF Transcript_662/g.772 Transcript_662/m.772 type:complete len:148 (+) Transcript_662:376-819(+)
MRSVKQTKYRKSKQMINDKNKEQMFKIKKLSKTIKMKQMNATMKRSYSAMNIQKKQREEMRNKRIVHNQLREKQRLSQMKMRVFEKEKLDEFRMAKKKGDSIRVKRILSDILWMKSKEKALTRALLDKIERKNHVRHSSLENLVNHI